MYCLRSFWSTSKNSLWTWSQIHIHQWTGSIPIDSIMDSTSSRRDFHGRKLSLRNPSDDGSVRTSSGDNCIDVVQNSSSISPPLPPLLPLPPRSTSTTIFYRNLSDVIASHPAATSGGVRISAPRHVDVTSFSPPRLTCANSESGLPNIGVFIDTFYSVPSSAAATAANAVVSSTHDASSPSTVSCGGISGVWSSPSHSTINIQATVDDVFRHHHSASQHHPQHHHHYHHQNHQQQQAPQPLAFISSTTNDRLLRHFVQLTDNDDDGDDFFRDASMSHVMESSVMDDGTDGVGGFPLTGPDLQDVWGLGLGLRLFEATGGVGGDYDDDMPPLESINSTPEQEGVRKIQSVCSKLGIGSGEL